MAHRYYASQKYATLKQATWQAVKDARRHAKKARRRRKQVKSLMARLRRTHWLLSLDSGFTRGA